MKKLKDAIFDLHSECVTPENDSQRLSFLPQFLAPPKIHRESLPGIAGLLTNQIFAPDADMKWMPGPDAPDEEEKEPGETRFA